MYTLYEYNMYRFGNLAQTKMNCVHGVRNEIGSANTRNKFRKQRKSIHSCIAHIKRFGL